MYQFASKKFNAPEWRLFEWHREFLIYLIAAIIILAGVSKASALTTSSIYVNPNGLVRYYDFSDHTGTSITDRSDWADTGALTATPSWVQGYYGAGLSFASSSSQYGSSGAVIGVSGAQTRTMSFWVKLVSASATNCIAGWGNGTGTSNNFYVFAYNSQWYVNWFGDDLYFGTANTNWNYIAVTYDGSSIKTYVNGVYVNTASIALNTPNAKLELGRRTYDGNYLNGNLDEVKLWSRTLSAEEVYVDYLGTYQLIEQYYANSTAMANLNSTVIAGFNAAAVNMTNMNGTVISGFNNVTTFNSSTNNTLAYVILLLNGMINNASISNSSNNDSVAYLKSALDALTIMQQSANNNMSVFNQSTNGSLANIINLVNSLANLTGAQVWAVAARTLTDYNQTLMFSDLDSLDTLIRSLANASASDLWLNDINRTTNCTNCDVNITVNNTTTTNNYDNTITNNYSYNYTENYTLTLNETNTTNTYNYTNNNYYDNSTNSTINNTVNNDYTTNLNKAQLKNISKQVWAQQPEEDKSLLWYIFYAEVFVVVVLVVLIIRRRWFA